MTVQGRKDEILHLIRRVSSADEPEPQPAATAVAPQRSAAGALSPGALVRQRRKQVEEKLLSAAGPPHQLRELERRLAAIEDRLEEMHAEGRGGPARAPTALPAAQASKPAAPAPVEAGAPRAADPDDVLAGRIAEGVLADILQMLSSNLASGKFLIKGTAGEELRLYFEEGQIVHAAGMGLSGESALFAGMAIEKGRFSFRDSSEQPPERTIGNKTQFLILEALRQIDEARAGGGGHE